MLLIVLSIYLGYQQSRDLTLPPSHHSGTDIPKQAESDSLKVDQKLHPEQHVSRPPRIQELNWRVSSGYRRPDGVRKRVYLINGGLITGRPSLLVIIIRLAYTKLSSYECQIVSQVRLLNPARAIQ
jgi:hypothetical protein